MTWLSDGSLQCDTCRHVIDLPGMPRVMVIEGARAHGWHCYVGRNFTDTADVESFLCPECVNSKRPKLPPPPPVLVEDSPLFDL